MAVSIKTPRTRARLPERRKPYYYRVGPKTPWSLGYRKTTAARVWVLRYRDLKTKNYRTQRLATADDSATANSIDVLDFDQALRLAEQVYTNIVAGAPDGPTLTIEDAAYGPKDARTGGRKGGYIADREAEGKNTSTSANALEAHILPRWGETRIADLTPIDLKNWRDDLANAAPRRHSSRFADRPNFADVDLSDPDVKRRRRSTVNRITTTFKAVLNFAARMYPDECPNRETWREGLKAFRDVEVPRERWLTRDEVIRLLNACRPDFRQTVQAALYTGCRYGELCRSRVGHYNSDIQALRIPTSKSGKWRDVILHDEAASFFDALTTGRSTDDWLLERSDPALVALREAFVALTDWSNDSTRRAIEEVAELFDIKPGSVAQRLQYALSAPAAARVALGQEHTLGRLSKALKAPWGPAHQTRAMAAACKAAKISPEISFHGLRHTYASLAAQSGMALLALARNLGHADTRMVEKHYGHLSDQYMREQVANFAPTFGVQHRDEKLARLRPKSRPQK